MKCTSVVRISTRCKTKLVSKTDQRVYDGWVTLYKEDLHATSSQFRRGANQVRKRMWWKDLKWKIIIGVTILVILGAIIGSIVGTQVIQMHYDIMIGIVFIVCMFYRRIRMTTVDPHLNQLLRRDILSLVYIFLLSNLLLCTSPSTIYIYESIGHVVKSNGVCVCARV